MKKAYLHRFNYSSSETEGRLWVPDVGWFATIEPPWSDNRRFESCIPDGVYDLVPHSGGKYQGTVAMVNPGLDVYHRPEDRPHKSQRSVCVIHAANFAHELYGCIAPGLARKAMWSDERDQHLPGVRDSRKACKDILPVLAQGGWSLHIEAATGAVVR